MRPTKSALSDGSSAVSNQIRGSERKAALGFWLGVLLFAGVSLFFVWQAKMPLLLKAGVPNPLLLASALIAIPFLLRAIWETVRVHRFGDPVLDLVQLPVPLGGTVKGRVRLGPRFASGPEFKFKLDCVQRILRQTAKNGHYVETILWTRTGTTSLLPGGIVPVSVAVPDDQPETTTDLSGTSILWRLTVTAPFRPVRFLEKYEIPVRGRTNPAQRPSKQGTHATGRRLPTASEERKILLRSLPFIIIGLFAVAGGCYIMLFGLADVADAKASIEWPTVPGMIMASAPPAGLAVFGNPHLAYTYVVGNRTFTGQTIYPHLFWKSSYARKMTIQFPTYARVVVHYDASDPRKACLVPGLRFGAFQRLTLAGLLLAVGLMLASALLAPRDAELSGNSLTFRSGTLGGAIFGYSFLAVAVLGLTLWVVS